MSSIFYRNAYLSGPERHGFEDVTAADTPSQVAWQIGDPLEKYIWEPNVATVMRSLVRPFDRQIRGIGEATEPAVEAGDVAQSIEMQPSGTLIIPQSWL